MPPVVVGKADVLPEPGFEEESLGGGNGGVGQKGILGDGLVPLLHLLLAEGVGIAGACLHRPAPPGQVYTGTEPEPGRAARRGFVSS